MFSLSVCASRPPASNNIRVTVMLVIMMLEVLWYQWLRYRIQSAVISGHPSRDITSDIDSYIRGVSLWYHSFELWYHSTSDITVNIGVLVLWYQSLGDVISELPISVTPISESSDCNICKTPISGAVISAKLWYHSWQESRWDFRTDRSRNHDIQGYTFSSWDI
jgi:hypothetical protein